jgi:glycosyltransferase involved in cell wall biosynthesis
LDDLNPLEHPICFVLPRRLTPFSTWHEHIPFAMFLVDLLRPHTIVELGTQWGDSYCALCQAVKELNLDTRCYAIDTWKGDPHAGFYGPEVLADLRAHHDPLYGSFSRLIQSTFDEALQHFADGTIDLLHIDGYHIYEAVKHDFEAWLPKMSSQGVVLLHDINVPERDFGVKRFWEEIRDKYPHFEFLHGHGLGFLAIGSEYPKAFQALLDASSEDAAIIRQFFFELGRRLTLQVQQGQLTRQLAQLQAEGERLTQELAEKERAIGDPSTQLREREQSIAQLQASLFFKIWARYNSWRKRWSPKRTRRYHFYRLCVKAVHIASDEGLSSLFRQAWRYLRRRGLRGILTQVDRDRLYQLWIEKNEPKPSEFSKLQKEVLSLPYQPLISVVMPVYNIDEIWLRKAVESVRNQIYPNWELCIADDGSTRPHIRRVLEEYRRQDNRIKVTYLPHNQGISVASNAALALATGEFVGLLDHDDELAPWALSEVVKLLNQSPDLDLIYSDEDKLEPDGRRSEPFFKPDFSPDLLMSMNYICHFSVFRRSLLKRIGGFRKGFEGSQDYDVILRVSEQTTKIAHIPKILYHWRRIPGSASSSVSAKSYAYEKAVKALEEALKRRNKCGEVTVLVPGRYRIRYKVADNPLVSIIIPTKDGLGLLRRCVESIREKTAYHNYEIVVVDDGSRDLAAVDYLRRMQRDGDCRVVVFDQPFNNYSRINNFAVTRARGAFLVFLSNDTEIITPEWLEEMLGHAQRPEVGAVGAKLLFPNGTIQHGGVIVGLHGVAGHAFYGLPATDPGYMCLTTVVRNCSAVTGACLMMRRSVFEEIGGFDEELDVAYNDVDLCLRIVQRGYYIVWTPHAVLYHHEMATRGRYQPERNIRYFCNKWRDFLDRGDPFYNPNLALDRSDFMIKV